MFLILLLPVHVISGIFFYKNRVILINLMMQPLATILEHFKQFSRISHSRFCADVSPKFVELVLEMTRCVTSPSFMKHPVATRNLFINIQCKFENRHSIFNNTLCHWDVTFSNTDCYLTILLKALLWHIHKLILFEKSGYNRKKIRTR